VRNIKTYQSKLSLTIALFILAVFAFVGFEIIHSNQQSELGVVVYVLTIIFLIYLYFTTSYKIIDHKELEIKVGILMNDKIDIGKISRIRKTKSLISSPAWSLDRIEIFYNKYDSVIISPKNRKEFIQDLQKINSSIIVEL